MAKSQLYKFNDLFGSKFPGKDEESQPITLNKIVIPIIQRDYAQGRKSASRIRTAFINSLYCGLIEKRQNILDFVYGDITDKGEMIPLDGQQRLTTLYLLHWYIARHENIPVQECHFLHKFTYETRVSAREFFDSLANYKDIDFTKDNLSEDIMNQNWFPYDWEKDPTIMSVLTMIDAIHAKFKSSENLWPKLEEGLIAFYFLPIKDMGLTDDLYIKMNSRGKPLTEFEHFKAELDAILKKYDDNLAKRIIKKIDLAWTDMLWPYRGENNIIDDEFMRYFIFIATILYYRQGITKFSTDPFDIAENLFKDNRENVSYMEKMFDIWCNVGNIDHFFQSIYTKGNATEGKIRMFFPSQDDNVNLFLDCCNNFGMIDGRGIRAFSWPKFLCLYAVTQYLHCKDNISQETSYKRLRAVNNIINASEFEMREDRMQTILQQIDKIIIDGNFDYLDKSLNKLQIEEEATKVKFLEEHPEKAPIIYKLEDHYLLKGTISILGLENIDKVDKFYDLFNGNPERNSLIGRAMLSIGDYSQLNNWRYQIGTKMDSSWISLFHTSSRPGFKKTKSILNELLDMTKHLTDEFLEGIIKGYLSMVKEYDWRYYIIKYEQARPERYGMYYWRDYIDNGNSGYDFMVMFTEWSIGGRNWMAILKILFDECGGELANMSLGEYAYSGDGDYLLVQSQDIIYKVKVVNSGYKVYIDDILQDKYTVVVPQNEQGIDIEDRIPIGIRLIKQLANSNN